ncbi:efflux RND transporter periplasmic adaptor subunit [Paenibacillus protaetiae]|nr:efflux RND transporter periplasmic adaptor subunit [Paenibacillus protaetiae]
MRKWMIWLGILIILVAAGGGAYYYFFKDKDHAGTEKKAAAITARVTRGNIVNQISGTGSVVANSRETVTAGKSGTLAKVNFKEGDSVKKGQVIATFEDSDDYADQIKTITRSIEKLQQQLADDQEKYKEATGTENEEQTKESIDKDMSGIQDDIADNQEDLQDIYDKKAAEVKDIVSPIDGQVTNLAVQAGDEVQANTTIAEIVNYNYLEFVTSVDELDIPKVTVGQTANITLSSYSNKTFEGSVSEIAKEGTSSNGSSSFQVSILLKDIDGVMVGMSGQAAITIESRENVLEVPVNAVVSVGGKSYVRVQTEDGAGASGTGAGGAGAGSSGSGQAGAGAAGQSGAGQGQGRAGRTGAGQGQAGAWTQGGSGANAASSPSGEGQSRAGRFSGGGQAGAWAQGGQGADAQRGTGGAAASGSANRTVANGSAAAGQTEEQPQSGTGAGQDGPSKGQSAAGTGSDAAQDPRMQALLSRIDTLGGKLVEVTTGLSNDAFVEIMSGLEEGQVVLIPSPQGAVGMGQSSTQQQQFAFPGGFGGGGFGGGASFGGGFAGGGNRASSFSRGGGGAR